MEDFQKAALISGTLGSILTAIALIAYVCTGGTLGGPGWGLSVFVTIFAGFWIGIVFTPAVYHMMT